MSPATRLWMSAYALMAVAYRWGLMLLILWFVSLALRPYGLESLGRLLCMAAAVGLLWTSSRPVIQFLRSPARRQRLRLSRTLVTALGTAGFAAMMFYPLPAGVSGSARILPGQEASVYISTPGFLDSLHKAPGMTVRKGDLLATLVNREVELEYLAAQGRLATQQRIVESLRRAAVTSPDAAVDLPAQQAMLEDLRSQLERRESRRAGLRVLAPIDGTLIAATRRPEREPVTTSLVSWTGLPTDPRNQQCFLQPGEELMSIATGDRWDAEMILSQSDVQRIGAQSRVKMVLESAPADKLWGTVTDVSRAEWTPDEHGQRRDDRESVRQNQPLSTSYVVRVQLDAVDNDFIAGTKAIGRIEAKPMSLAGRLWRTLTGLLRFR